MFREVYKYYGALPALRGASFKVPRGVVAGLVGPNGSGKTTSLKLILGLLKPNSGAVLVRGVEPWRSEEIRSIIGFLPEKPIYPKGVKVGAFLRLVARLRGLNDADALRAAKLVGIDQYWDKSIGSLSRGYIQRLGIAQAIIGEPEILLLDEPTSNLDPSARAQILELISVLARDLGSTIIVSSHILPELEKIVNYLVFICKGRILDYGYAAELATRYSAPVKIDIETSRSREVARILMGVEGVRGVDLSDDRVVAIVDSRYFHELEKLLDELRDKGLISSWSPRTSLLEELYSRALGGGIEA